MQVTLLYYSWYLNWLYLQILANLPVHNVGRMLRSYSFDTSIGIITEDIRRKTANMRIGIHLILGLLDTVLPEREIGCTCL